MGFWQKIGAFFKNFGKNVKADPVSSLKGVAQLAAGGMACYGMATGAVPINVGAPMAAGLVTSGIHALGTDSTTGQLAPAADAATQVVQIAAAETPTVMTAVESYKQLAAEASAAKEKLDQFQAVSMALNSALSAAQPIQGQPGV